MTPCRPRFGSSTLIPASVALAMVGLQLFAAAAASAQLSTTCNRIQYSFDPMILHGLHRPRWSTRGNDPSPPDSSLLPANYAAAMNKIDYSMVRFNNSSTDSDVWYDFVNTTGSGWNNAGDLTEVLHRRNDQGAFGTATLWHYWPSNVIDQIDMFVNGPTTLSGATAHPAGALLSPTACASPGPLPFFFREVGTVQHETGHAYGYDHFDDWLSQLNTSQADSMPCSLLAGQTVTRTMYTDGYMVSCIANVYGSNYTGVDLAVTPTIQPSGCTLSASSCATVPSATTVLPAASNTLAGQTIQVTTYSTHAGFTGSVGWRAYMVPTTSSNLRGGVVVGEGSSSSGWTAGNTRRRSLSILFFPQTAMPVVGVTYRVIVEFDPTNAVTEYTKHNNLTDTQYFWRRE